MMKFRRLSMFDLLTDMELSDRAKKEISIVLDGTEFKDVGNVCLVPKEILGIYVTPDTNDEIERALHHAGLDFCMTNEDLEEYENKRIEEHYHDYCRQNWRNHKKGFKKDGPNPYLSEISGDLLDFLKGEGRFEGVNDRNVADAVYRQLLREVQARRSRFYVGCAQNRIKD